MARPNVENECVRSLWLTCYWFSELANIQRTSVNGATAMEVGRLVCTMASIHRAGSATPAAAEMAPQIGALEAPPGAAARPLGTGVLPFGAPTGRASVPVVAPRPRRL